MHPRVAIPQPKSNADDYNQRSLPQYTHAVEQAGGEPVIIDLRWSNAEIARAASSCDAVLLPGSSADLDPQKFGAERYPQTAPADPARDNVDELLLQDAYNMHKPILGICYGIQSLNVWRTGTLVQHIESKLGINHEAGRSVPRAHTVIIDPKSWILGRVLAPVCELMEQMEQGPGDENFCRRLPKGGILAWVNSSHHQSVDRAGDGLHVVARGDDGVIEAVESTSPEHYVLGVQWHPERGYDGDEVSRAIFRSFVQAAWQRKGSPRNDTIDYESVAH